MEAAAGLHDLKHLKKISPSRNHSHLKLGDYRLGLTTTGNTVTLVRFLHRKEIYRYFP